MNEPGQPEAIMIDCNVELKACPTPWCDGSHGKPYVFARRVDILGVCCPSCGVSTRYFGTEAEAREQWNTRISPCTDARHVAQQIEAALATEAGMLFSTRNAMIAASAAISAMNQIRSTDHE